MSLQRSRYESQSIVNSFNLFVDTQKAAVIGDGRSTGDNYLLHLGSNAIEAQDGEIIRLSLVNFNMFNNIYGVNLTNCKFRLTTDRTARSGAIQLGEINIPRKNYKTVGAMATSFAAVLADGLLTQSQAAGGLATKVDSIGVNDILPKPTTALNATDDRLINILFTFRLANNGVTPSMFQPGEVFIQCHRQVGDSYALLGAIGIDSTPVVITDTATVPTESSFKVTVTTNTIRVESYFPAQRMTDPHVYLRCGSTQNGLESVVLSDPIGNPSTGRYDTEVQNSNIMAKIQRDAEFITFDSASTDEYFINLQQRKLSSLRLFLTDSKARPLGRLFHADTISEGTASGLQFATGANSGKVESTTQNKNGNLFFDCVIKVELIQVRHPQTLDTPPPPSPFPAREAQSVLTWQDYGRPKF